METEALDDALTVFAATAPRFGSVGLANHGPMAAEALAHLGRHDAIAGWVARYRTRLDDAPPAARPLTEEDWPAALGAGRPLPRMARAVRAGDRRPAHRGRGGGVGAAPAPRVRRRRHPRPHPHRPRAACARRRRHAAPAPRGGERPGLLGVELPGTARAAAADRARRCGRCAWPTCPTFPRTRRARCSSATGSPPWPTSPTNSSRRWRRSAGPARRWTCSTSWRRVERGRTCAMPTPAVRSASCTP